MYLRNCQKREINISLQEPPKTLKENAIKQKLSGETNLTCFSISCILDIVIKN